MPSSKSAQMYISSFRRIIIRGCWQALSFIFRDGLWDQWKIWHTLLLKCTTEHLYWAYYFVTVTTRWSLKEQFCDKLSSTLRVIIVLGKGIPEEADSQGNHQTFQACLCVLIALYLIYIFIFLITGSDSFAACGLLPMSFSKRSLCTLLTPWTPGEFTLGFASLLSSPVIVIHPSLGFPFASCWWSFQGCFFVFFSYFSLIWLFCRLILLLRSDRNFKAEIPRWNFSKKRWVGFTSQYRFFPTSFSEDLIQLRFLVSFPQVL